MSVQNEQNSQAYVFFDVDGTVTYDDTGEETFIEAGECARDEYFEIMSQTHAPGRNEPESGRGNELLETLTEKSREEVSELEKAARSLEADTRRGLEAGIRRLSEEGRTVIAHSAGWMPAIETVTNGHFDEKFAGRLTEDGPEFNGRYQKPVKMQNHIVSHGKEPVETETYFVGDSDTDLEAIRYAAATQGHGLALSDTPEKADERVTEASAYVGSPRGDYAAALIHALGSDQDTEEFVREEGLDLSEGEAYSGELAQTEEVEQAIQYLESLK